MNYGIKDFIDLKDCEDVDVKDVIIDDDNRTKTIVMERNYSAMFCPECGQRMYSKGFYTRHINHPVLDDGYRVIIELRQRKYRCTNQECNTYINESFNFVGANKRTTYITYHKFRSGIYDFSFLGLYIC